jgi:hypothetical protein
MIDPASLLKGIAAHWPHRAAFFLTALLILPAPGRLWPQDFYPGHDIEVLRGEVQIEAEPIYGGFIDREYPLPTESLRRRALEEAAMFYSAMIYGWSFHYDIGERARGIEEEFELTPLGIIPWGDRKLSATDVELRDQKLCLWTDYRLDDPQKRRVAMWRANRIRSVQAQGLGPLGMPRVTGTFSEDADTADAAGAGDTDAEGNGNANDADGDTEPQTWLDYKREGLEDAARAAIRAMLRGSERNRPKEATGFIALAAFPVFGIDSGRWTAFARFRVDVTEVVPFGAY